MVKHRMYVFVVDLVVMVLVEKMNMNVIDTANVIDTEVAIAMLRKVGFDAIVIKKSRI